MKKPKKMVFHIGPHTIPVEFDEHIDGALGYFNVSGKGGAISISPRLDPSHRTDTILHELVHALDYYLGLNLEHSQVHGLGTGLAQALGPYLKDK